ncbi:MAG: DNA methyltransferase [Pseudomonadota bacterium]
MMHHGDCLSIMRTFGAESFDAMVTDPPAGIAFMGKEWDKDKGGRAGWVAWMTEVMAEALRVLKPGAHALVWAIPRTSHWTATALEDAGFEIRDVVTHLFGTGFPKSLDVSKAIDKAAGAERAIVGHVVKRTAKGGNDLMRNNGKKTGCSNFTVSSSGAPTAWIPTEIPITAPATASAKQWQGFGTALKPAAEHWILCRKPLAEKTVAANMLKHGTGAVNIDGCRIPGAIQQVPQPKIPDGDMLARGKSYEGRNGEMSRAEGRFPANLVLSHNPDCEEIGTKEVKTSEFLTTHRIKESQSQSLSGKNYEHSPPKDFGKGGKETVAAWRCTEGCAVAELDGQSGVLKSGLLSPANNVKASSGWSGGSQADRVKNTFKPNEGGASRFFYTAKASKSDRGEGNTHPTVKSRKLMAYLCRLVTPPGGTVLDPFAGSGSTGVAALAEGFGFVGIEQDESYFRIAESRLGGGIFG